VKISGGRTSSRSIRLRRWWAGYPGAREAGGSSDAEGRTFRTTPSSARLGCTTLPDQLAASTRGARNRGVRTPSRPTTCCSCTTASSRPRLTRPSSPIRLRARDASLGRARPTTGDSVSSARRSPNRVRRLPRGLHAPRAGLDTELARRSSRRSPASTSTPSRSRARRSTGCWHQLRAADATTVQVHHPRDAAGEPGAGRRGWRRGGRRGRGPARTRRPCRFPEHGHQVLRRTRSWSTPTPAGACAPRPMAPRPRSPTPCCACCTSRVLGDAAADLRFTCGRAPEGARRVRRVVEVFLRRDGRAGHEQRSASR